MNLEFIGGINNSVTKITVIIILVLFVLTMGASLFQNKKTTMYPPFGMSCPDYWTSRKATIGGEEGYLCTADSKNKNSATNIINNDYVYYYPSNSKTTIFSRGSPMKNIDYKKQWANESGIAWDGCEV
jgi:hypothetical protein